MTQSAPCAGTGTCANLAKIGGRPVLLRGHSGSRLHSRQNKQSGRSGMRDLRIRYQLVGLAAAMTVASQAGAANKEPEIPKCEKRYGALAVHEPETKWWRDLQ